MNCCEHRPWDKFGLGMPFNVQASLKGREHVLMTKFAVLKIRCCSFGSFRIKIKKVENTKRPDKIGA
jgi:hypothetical protein